MGIRRDLFGSLFIMGMIGLQSLTVQGESRSTAPATGPSSNAAASTRPGPERVRSDAIRTCQVGYLPGETKFAILASAPAGDVTVRRSGDGASVLVVKAAPPVRDADSGDTVQAVDFSALKEPGTYYLGVPGVGTSYDFQISPDAFTRPFRLAMRAFTGQRCGTAVSLAPDFPEFHYDACHTADAQFHASSGKQGSVPCTGGWHDAGDYGRYVVNSGITTGTLLWAYELNEPKLRRVNLSIPESGGPIPDVLAEIKWNIDWMLKMQDPADGGVWHKATSANFVGFVLPKDDREPVLIIGSGKTPYKTAEATADFAAVCAIAGRLYRPFDNAYADRCLAAAERAWTWALAHPDAHFDKNPDGIKTGGYGDKDSSDERLWAAAELFRTTGKQDYNRYFLSHYAKWSPPLTGDAAQGWPNVQNLAMYTYAMSGRDTADAKAVGQIRAAATAAADAIVQRVRANPYRVPLKRSDYIWGSNAVAANYAMMLLLANHLAPNADYVNASQDVLHYLLGRNTFNTSYVTQVGARWPMHPHHRPSGADTIEQPWPGMLVGGPNADGKSPPARQWVDELGSYTTNEIAINWNAPLVFMLAEVLPAPGAK
jgi:endoglucanase